jgi:hypothetical protein
MTEERLLTDEQSANIHKLLYALRVLHFPDTDDPTTHVEIKYVNASGVDQILCCTPTDIEKFRNMADTPIENLEQALSSLLML